MIYLPIYHIILKTIDDGIWWQWMMMSVPSCFIDKHYYFASILITVPSSPLTATARYIPRDSLLDCNVPSVESLGSKWSPQYTLHTRRVSYILISLNWYLNINICCWSFLSQQLITVLLWGLIQWHSQLASSYSMTYQQQRLILSHNI